MARRPQIGLSAEENVPLVVRGRSELRRQVPRCSCASDDRYRQSQHARS